MRRSEPATLLLILLCFLATANMEWRDLDPYAAGAICAPIFWHGAWERAITAIFLHGGWLHFGLNALALWVVARVIVVGLGRLAMLFFLFGSALVGLAASLILLPPDTWRMGISGGIAGLVGLILAVEWAVARDARAFLKARNVRVIGFFIVLNAGLAVAAELWWTGAKLDHAAHVAGLLYGIAAGLVWFVRGRRPRVARGVIVGSVLALVPLAYAARPVFSADYKDPRQHLFAGELAWASGQQGRARHAFTKALELDPTLLEAAARVAVLDDDPARLDAAGRPRDLREANLLAEALLELAARRLQAEPDVAARLTARAQRIGPVGAAPWRAFADKGWSAGREDLAVIAEREAVRRERRSSIVGASPDSAYSYLEALREEDLRGLLPAQRIGAARDRARLVWEAAARLADTTRSKEDRASEQRTLERDLDAAVTEVLAVGDAPPPRIRAETALLLKRAWRRLAENAVLNVWVARYRLRAARWAERQHDATLEAGAAPEAEDVALLAQETEGLYRAAYAEGRESGDAVAVAQAGHWLRAHGIEPPPPEPEEATDEPGDGSAPGGEPDPDGG